ncbi:hypothetical protein [Octadecabacter antarcticus]|nr:hypothetical protein [Octadecabacter antarcticus]
MPKPKHHNDGAGLLISIDGALVARIQGMFDAINWLVANVFTSIYTPA